MSLQRVAIRDYAIESSFRELGVYRAKCTIFTFKEIRRNVVTFHDYNGNISLLFSKHLIVH